MGCTWAITMIIPYNIHYWPNGSCVWSLQSSHIWGFILVTVSSFFVICFKLLELTNYSVTMSCTERRDYLQTVHIALYSIIGRSLCICLSCSGSLSWPPAMELSHVIIPVQYAVRLASIAVWRFRKFTINGGVYIRKTKVRQDSQLTKYRITDIF